MHTFLFLKLSIVRHFPKATIHTKKVTLEGIFCFQMLVHGKNCSLWPARRWKYTLTINPLLLLDNQHLLSSPIPLTGVPKKVSMKLQKASNSRLCTSLQKCIS